MNALSAIDIGVPVVTDWDPITATVNRWRGECIHHFATIEMTVTETLFSLDAVKQEGATVGLRHLIGQRLDDLASAIAPDGPFGAIAKAASDSLIHYRHEHEEFRNTLCHGQIKIARERNGRWLLIVRALSIRSGQAEHSITVIEQATAEAKLTALKRDAQNLSNLLRRLRTTCVGNATS